jgi:hypothetical protein
VLVEFTADLIEKLLAKVALENIDKVFQPSGQHHGSQIETTVDQEQIHLF